MRERLVISGLALVALVAVGSCKDDVGLTSIPPEPERFIAFLSGANEPTPIASAAQGFATLTRQGDSLFYRITVSNIDSATLAHIHAGPAGINGGVMRDLFVRPSPITDLDFSGTLIEDTLLTVADTVLTRMRSGTAYVNVHTRVNGGGEIRGQIFRQ